MTKRIEFGTIVRGRVYHVNGGSEANKYSKLLPTLENKVTAEIAYTLIISMTTHYIINNLCQSGLNSIYLQASII